MRKRRTFSREHIPGLSRNAQKAVDSWTSNAMNRVSEYKNSSDPCKGKLNRNLRLLGLIGMFAGLTTGDMGEGVKIAANANQKAINAWQQDPSDDNTAILKNSMQNLSNAIAQYNPEAVVGGMVAIDTAFAVNADDN